MPIIEAPAPPPAIVVVGHRAPAPAALPSSSETIDIVRLRDTTNVRNAEDSLRYLPSLFVRKRHIGDTQAPVATRTSGVGSSARSLILADGVLLSALIGNNNSFASPRWGMVSPEEIDRVDVRYGPFFAGDPGNAIGAVVNITTRLPDRLQASATAAVNVQTFDQYGTRGRYPAYQLAGTIGDRVGPFAWFASVNHVDSRSQPLAYVTTAPLATTPTTSLPATGAIADRNRLGAPIFVIGAGGFEHQRQDNLKLRLAADLGPTLRLRYTGGLFLNDTTSRAETYLSSANGPLFAGTLNVGTRAISVPASAFSNQVYRFDERHWMHALTLAQTAERFSWSAVGSLYDYDKSEQRIPSTALPAAETGGAGSIVRLDGTGWRTLDLTARWRVNDAHQLSGGLHHDRFVLANRRFATSDWRSGGPGALVQSARGKTRTNAVWLQDQWSLLPRLTLTAGARYEWWRAYDGFNFPTSPGPSTTQPVRTTIGLSPKLSLRWQPASDWSVTLSGGRALRFPTVSELYQAISTGNSITVPDPTLRPERARSAELAVEHNTVAGKLRLSLFDERIRDALLSQMAVLAGSNSTALFSFVQNVGETQTTGVEVAFDRRDLLPGFDLSGSVTLADPKITANAALPNAIGKLIPQVPRRRATLVATWRPTATAALTFAGRYASRLYGTIDNSDIVGHTYQGFEGYVVADARASLNLSRQWRASIGVENLTDHRYYLFHPFPGRTFTAELNWRW